MMNIFKKLFSKAVPEPEKRSLGRDAFGGAFNGSALYPGSILPVSEQTVLGIPGAMCAIRVIAEAFADLPVQIVKQTNGVREVVENHPLEYLLNSEPNPEMTAFSLKETLIHHLLAWGNCYIEIEWSNGGNVLALHLLLPSLVRILRDEAGQLIYNVTEYPSMNTRTITADNIIHVKNMSYDGMIGLSPVQLARQSLQLSHNAETYGARYFANGGKPGGILKTANRLSDPARENLAKSWKNDHGGSENSNKIAILEEGIEWQSITLPPEDSQFLATREFQLGEISRIFNISPVFLHDLGRATWNNLGTLNMMMVQRTLMPWIRKAEQEINRKVFQKNGLGIHFNVDGMLRGDTKTRFDVYHLALQDKILTVNEVRSELGRPPVEWGDEPNQAPQLGDSQDANDSQDGKEPTTEGANDE